MRYLLDTNIVLLSELNARFDADFDRRYRRGDHEFLISVVTQGELLSLAIQRGWGERRKQELEAAISKFIILPIRVRTIIDAYAQLDAYSQGKLPGKPLPDGLSSRNMGKNDLWIAATASVTNARLITTDNDFDHLNGVFLEVDKLDIIR